MFKVLQPEPGIEIYVPCCGSGGLLVKCEVAMEERAWGGNGAEVTPLEHHCQENAPETWPIANMIIRDFEGVVKTAATFKNPRYRNW
jgi:type I restriction enzyme M protein